MAFSSVPFAPSKNISDITYDPDIQTLRVVYSRKGQVYQYQPVTGDMVAGFGQALSASDYLRQFIIGQVVEERLTDGG